MHKWRAGTAGNQADRAPTRFGKLRHEFWFEIIAFAFVNAISIAPTHASEPPNILVILADDQSYRDFGFMGNDSVHTPHIDKLAANSARFPNAYVPMSVCRPSLATLLTGLYPHQHGIHFNHPPPGLNAMRKMTAVRYRETRAKTDDLILRVPTIPRILADHGYICLQTGKHWEGSYKTAGFTHGMTMAMPSNQRTWVTGTRRQANGEWVAHGNGDEGLQIGRETMEPINRFVAQHAGSRPFLIWYAPFLPHTPFDAPRRFRQLYSDRNIPEHLLPYYAEIARFDDTVGRLLNTLANHDVLDDTLILFISDNGFRPRKDQVDRHDSRSKLSQYEDGLRSPLLISWRGHTVDRTHSQLVQSVDLVPTILDATGLSTEKTSQMKGISLIPAACGDGELPDRAAFGAIYPNDATELGAPEKHVRGRWIRSGQYKLIVPGPGSPPLPIAMYDLASDPEELNNLAKESEYSAERRRLQDQLDRWWNPSLANAREH